MYGIVRFFWFSLALGSSLTLFLISFHAFDDEKDDYKAIRAYKCFVFCVFWLHTLFLLRLSFWSGLPMKTYKMGEGCRALMQLFVIFSTCLLAYFSRNLIALLVLGSIFVYAAAVVQFVIEAEDMEVRHVFMTFFVVFMPAYAAYTGEPLRWFFFCVAMALLLVLVTNKECPDQCCDDDDVDGGVPYNLTQAPVETCSTDEAEEIPGEWSSGPRVCSCQQTPRMWISWTHRNPCRRFVCCPNYKTEKKCDFFAWIDPAITGWQKNRVVQMRTQVMEKANMNGKLNDANRLLREEIEELKSKLISKAVGNRNVEAEQVHIRIDNYS